VGEYLHKKLLALKDKYDVVKDVRGRGLLQGIEIEGSQNTDKFALGQELYETMLRNGLRDKGFEWAVADGSPIPVLRNGPAVITPIDKVYKRFVNGREDNVVSLLYSYASDCTDGPIVIR